MTNDNRKIRRVSVANFATFDSAALDFCPGINVLIGANATGKTLIERLTHNKQWRTPRSCNPEITPELERIILKPMALKPEERYQTAFELQQELEPYAITLQERAIEVTIELTAEECNDRGVMYLNVGKFEEALIDFSTAIRIKPDIAIIYSNRGILYANLQRYAEALSDFTQAIHLEFKRADVYYI